MKKIKLLASLSALTTLGSGVAISATGCSNDGNSKNKDEKLLITFNYSDSDVISPDETVTWSFNISYNSNPTTLKKVEVTSSNTKVATVKVPDPTKQEFQITGKANGETWITVKVTDNNDHYNELSHEVYVSGEAVTSEDNYIGTIYGRFKINDEITQDDINALVPNYSKQIIIAGAAISPEILTELHIIKTDGKIINFPEGFLKGCTNLKQLNLSGIKTTSIQNTYLAKPVLGEFAVNRLQTLVVPQLVTNDPTGEIVLTDFLYSETGMPALTTVDLTGFANVKRIKGWWFCHKCTALTNINLEAMSNLVEVGVAFMYGCSAIENVNLSTWSKVQVIRNTFMYGCSSLQSLDMSKLSDLRVIGAEFLQNCTSLTTFRFPGEYNQDGEDLVPVSATSKLQSIGWDTECNEWGVYGHFLYGCTSLKSLDFTTLNPDEIYGATYKVGTDVEFKKDSEPRQTIYLEPQNSKEDKISYMLFGCKSLTEVNFGTLDVNDFGSPNSQVPNFSAFYTTSFDSKAKAEAYIADDKEPGIKYLGVNSNNLVTTSGANLFVTEAKEINGVWYARKWTLGDISLHVYTGFMVSPDGIWTPSDGTNPGTFAVDQYANNKKAKLYMNLTAPVPDGSKWKVVDAADPETEITAATFASEDADGILTIDLDTWDKQAATWIIKYDDPDVTVKEFTFNVKQNENGVRFEAAYANDDSNPQAIKDGDVIDIEYGDGFKFVLKNAPVNENEDNIRIISCVGMPNFAQSTETGKKNEATWSYGGGVGKGQLVMIAAFDLATASSLPVATFSLYKGDSTTKIVGWDVTDISCDQEGAFTTTANQGTWTNPDKTAQKTVKLAIPSKYNVNWQPTIFATHWINGDLQREEAVSGSRLDSGLEPTFYYPDEETTPETTKPFTPITFKTKGDGTEVNTAIILIYNPVGYDETSFYYMNYILIAHNTN